ncbi:MAG: hypothetical protein J0I00_15455 [Burkholderiales bacterium]|nr:hypothetical protein [Burkholderiales bacterium]
MPTHAQLDERARALHRLAAARVRAEPALFERVRANLARWQRDAAPQVQPYVSEWQALADQGLPACLAMAEEDSPHADALRQASPFAGILSNAERLAFLKDWRARQGDAAR